jgi:hypothetical protein
MAAKKDCGCGGKARAARVQVQLAGGTRISKKNLTEATQFAARHPGSKVLGGAKAA